MIADQEQFHQLLNTLLSTKNENRTKAEEAYSNMLMESKVTYLLGAIHNGQMTEEARTMAAVLLRRLFSSGFMEFHSKLPVEAQAQLKEQVLLTIQIEQSVQMRRKVCDVVSEVARNLIDDDGNNQWPEFLQYLFQCSNAPNPHMKEAALRMFTSVPGVFGNEQSRYLDLIKQMLQQSLMPESGYDVRFQAVRAVGAFIILHDKDSVIHKHFADLLLGCLMVLVESIEKQDDTALLIIDLAESTPKFLRSELECIFQICINAFSDTNMDDSWRQLSLEVMVTLSETAPAMVRKVNAKYVAALVPLVLQMMCDIEDEDDCAVSDEIIEDDSECNNVVTESSLDRLACGLGGKIMLPLVIQNIPSMLSHSDWKQRHAALMAISAVGEDCHKQMESMLDEIMSVVL